MARMKMAWVEWLDHCGSGTTGWKDISEIEGLRPIVMTSVGWVINETPKFITLAASVHGEASREKYMTRGCGDVCIMKCAVIKRRNIPQNWIS